MWKNDVVDRCTVSCQAYPRIREIGEGCLAVDNARDGAYV